MPSLSELVHRTFFRLSSLLPPRGQGMVLRRYFDWRHRIPDPWRSATDDFGQQKYLIMLRHLPPRRYRHIIEIGCGEGVFTLALAATYPEAEIIGVDVSERALTRARGRAPQGGRVSFMGADILTRRPEHRFDLVFCSDTHRCLGREERLRLFSGQLSELLAPGGVLVAVHPWPEAERLHGVLYAHRSLKRVREQVYATAPRPFAITVYRMRSNVPG